MGSSRRNDEAPSLGLLAFEKEVSIGLRKRFAYTSINSRLRRKTPVLKRGSWECWLAGSNRVDLSPPASLRIRDPFLRLATLFQTSVGLARRANAPCLPSRRVSQLPDPLPDASSAVRRRFSLHQFPDWIAPFRRPSAVLSLRITPRPLAFLRLATLFHLERGVGSTGWQVRIE